jgi:hypothetical protein
VVGFGVGTTRVGSLDFISGNEECDCLQSAKLIARAGEQTIARITTIPIMRRKFFISNTTGLWVIYYLNLYDGKS